MKIANNERKNSKKISLQIKYRVNDHEFEIQEEAEEYARLVTNSVSSKVWINKMVYSDGQVFCVNSYNL